MKTIAAATAATAPPAPPAIPVVEQELWIIYITLRGRIKGAGATVYRIQSR